MANAKMPAVKFTKTVKDSEGTDRLLTFHQGKGRHQLNAQRAAGTDNALIPVSLIQQLVTVDETKLTIDEWLDMDLEIFLEAQGGVFDNGSGKPEPEAS